MLLLRGLFAKSFEEETMKKFRNYKEHLFERLQDPKSAAYSAGAEAG